MNENERFQSPYNTDFESSYSPTIESVSSSQNQHSSVESKLSNFDQSATIESNSNAIEMKATNETDVNDVRENEKEKEQESNVKNTSDLTFKNDTESKINLKSKIAKRMLSKTVVRGFLFIFILLIINNIFHFSFI